jgi:IS30 family transposase
LIEKVDRHTAENVKEAILKLLKPIANKVHTITADNGKNFGSHEVIAQKLHADFFFAKPYEAWPAWHKREHQRSYSAIFS